MTHKHRILLLVADAEHGDRWQRELAAKTEVCTDLSALQATGQTVELIVTDQIPLTAELNNLADLVARGEIGVLGIGAEGPADVLLPRDCSGRELRLACRLLGDVVRLRRRIAEEVRTSDALRKMAYRDPLTGLANRRRWDHELVRRLEALRRQQSPQSLVVGLLDIDLFKPLNDRFGHVAGDATLQRIAHRLAANLVPAHLAARLGGDEFGVLLSGVLAADVLEVTERIRRALELKMQVDSQESPLVTVSAGVVVVTPPGALAPRDVLAAADQALRSAKQQGRNRTVAGTLP
jgi:diguanylate cyclase (GGDEF)-like protein